MNPNINDIFKNLSPAELSAGIAQAKAFLATPQGKKAMESIQRGEKVDESILPPGSDNIVKVLTENPSLLNTFARYLR
ncbi:MAG: hypothetical protein Q4C12_02045 [Clostridia bacterium]|nr:hypothetical protein [Clostridia bacterium]